ncbi:MAG: alpha/beta hydrolase fold domain-containing protein [Lachnospiraceae bacterium]|nr:alpha/beta hydrolase fold domain-containing protein [Lachnospiraceae bacterium]
MNRSEFIEKCKGLSEQELAAIAEMSRKRASGRIPEAVTKQFRSLDDVTSVQEEYIETAFGKTHVFFVEPVNRDEKEKRPVIINIHGGGWSLDHTERDIYFSRRLAHRLQALVIDIDYVLAPEYPYPAALEEIEALFDRLPELMGKWNGDENRIVVCGQSAGGNLAGAVMQRRKFKALPGIKAQILCYLPTDNYNDHFHGGELDERGQSTEYYGFFYNRVFEERKNHDVSILFADLEELKELPQTDIITAGLDNLKEEGEAYYKKLKEAGDPSSYRCFENSRHGFLVNLYDEWKEGEDYLTELMRKYF